MLRVVGVDVVKDDVDVTMVDDACSVVRLENVVCSSVQSVSSDVDESVSVVSSVVDSIKSIVVSSVNSVVEIPSKITSTSKTWLSLSYVFSA